MQEKKEQGAEAGRLTGMALEAEDVLAGAEEWAPVETKLVVWSLVAAVVFLVLGLLVVPTSILH
jgi:hypothetical protein